MGMFGTGGCPLCWDKECDCDPKKVAEYYQQQKLIDRLNSANTKTADELVEQIKYSYGAGPRGFTTRVYRGMGNCQLCDKNVWNCECGQPQFPNQTQQELDQEPGPIILASTSGDDYEVLNKVDARIKDLAVHGKLTDVPEIREATSDTLKAALGPGEEALTPENKYWILLSLWFKPIGKYQWSHPVLGDEILWFDIHNDLMVSLISRVFREGYKNASHGKLTKEAPVIQMQTLPNRG